MGLMGPTIKYFGVGDDGTNYGQLGEQGTGISPANALGNYQQMFLGAQSMGDDAVRQRMAGAIDPNTGKLLKKPQTAAEFAEVERQAQELASDHARQTFAQEAKMLGFAPNAGGTGIQGTGGSGQGTGMPGLSSQGLGGTGAGMGTGAGSIPAPTVDADLMAKFKTGLMSAIDNPGMDPRAIQDMVNQGNEGLSLAQSGDEQGLVSAANAAGFTPAGGSVQQGLTSIGSNYAGKKTDNARSIDISAEQDRKNKMLQALGMAGSNLEHQQDAQRGWYQWLEGRNRDDRNAMMGLMERQQPAIPSLTGGGVSNPGTGGQKVAFAGGMSGGNGPQGGKGSPPSAAANDGNAGFDSMFGGGGGFATPAANRGPQLAYGSNQGTTNSQTWTPPPGGGNAPASTGNKPATPSSPPPAAYGPGSDSDGGGGQGANVSPNSAMAYFDPDSSYNQNGSGARSRKTAASTYPGGDEARKARMRSTVMAA